MVVAMTFSAVVAQLLDPQDAVCSFQYMTDSVKSVHAACGTQTKTCSLGCAVIFLPFFKKCHATLSGMYAISGADTIDDSTSTVLERYAKVCRAQPATTLTTRINQLQNASLCVA